MWPPKKKCKGMDISYVYTFYRGNTKNNFSTNERC